MKEGFKNCIGVMLSTLPSMRELDFAPLIAPLQFPNKEQQKDNSILRLKMVINLTTDG